MPEPRETLLCEHRSGFDGSTCAWTGTERPESFPWCPWCLEYEDERRRLTVTQIVRPPETPKPCCGAVGKGRHEPGCPKRVAELARSGAFDD